MTEVTLPDGWAPYAVTGDATGTLWTTILDPPGIARVTPGDVRREADVRPGTDVRPGAVNVGQEAVLVVREAVDVAREVFEVRHEAFGGRPMLLAVTDDGALWCTRSDDRLVRRDVTGEYVVIELPAGSAPYGIAAIPGGGVWFTAPGLNQVGRATVAGDLTMIDLPVPDARAAMITVDADGDAWTALNGAGALARISAAAAPDGRTVAGESVKIIELPGGRATPAPVGVAASGAGVWYADIAGGCVGLVDRSGAVRQFAFTDPGCRPHAVAADPDGGCWVTLWGSGELARVTVDGDITLHTLPGREPHGLWISTAAESGAPDSPGSGVPSESVASSAHAASSVPTASFGQTPSSAPTALPEQTPSSAPAASPGRTPSTAPTAPTASPSRAASSGRNLVWVAMESGSLVAVDPVEVA